MIKACFFFDVNQLFCGKKKIALVIFFLIPLILLQLSIFQFKKKSEDESRFQEIENKKVQSYVYYQQYATYGYRILFNAANLSVLFSDSTILPETQSYVDAGERLKVYTPLIGASLFDQKKSGFTDFSGFLMIFGSLIVLIYGYLTYKNSDYHKFVATLSPGRKAFATIVISRMLILLLAIIILSGMVWLLLQINGISIDSFSYFSYYILTNCIVLFFFFQIGAVIGALPSEKSRSGLLLGIWFILTFVIPFALSKYTAAKANFMTPLHEIEMERLEIFMNFEKLALEKSLTYRNGEKLRQEVIDFVNSYMKNELNSLALLEERLHTEMQSQIKTYHFLSSFFPSTHYKCVSNELSSRGYNNLLDFHKYVQHSKHRFINFIIQKVYHENSSKVESFIQGDENIYRSKPGLPGYHYLGIMLTVFYTLVLCYINYRLYLHALYRKPESPLTERDIPQLSINSGQYTTIGITGKRGIDFKNRFYNVLSGKSGDKVVGDFRNRILINGIDPVLEPKTYNYFYLCPAEEFPSEIKVKSLLRFIGSVTGNRLDKTKTILNNPRVQPHLDKYIENLEPNERTSIFLHLLRMVDAEIYVINDICKDAPVNSLLELKEEMEQITKRGCIFIYLTTQTTPVSPAGIDHPGYWEKERWGEMMDLYRKAST